MKVRMWEGEHQGTMEFVHILPRRYLVPGIDTVISPPLQVVATSRLRPQKAVTSMSRVDSFALPCSACSDVSMGVSIGVDRWQRLRLLFSSGEGASTSFVGFYSPLLMYRMFPPLVSLTYSPYSSLLDFCFFFLIFLLSACLLNWEFVYNLNVDLVEWSIVIYPWSSTSLPP